MIGKDLISKLGYFIIMMCPNTPLPVNLMFVLMLIVGNLISLYRKIVLRNIDEMILEKT